MSDHQHFLCRTCNVVFDADAPNFDGHGDHELVHYPAPTPPPPVDRKKIETHLQNFRRHLAALTKDGITTINGHDTMMVDLLEFTLKLDKDIQALCMAGMDHR